MTTIAPTTPPTIAPTGVAAAAIAEGGPGEVDGKRDAHSGTEALPAGRVPQATPPTVADEPTTEAVGNTLAMRDDVSEEKLAVVTEVSAACRAAVCADVALRGTYMK